MKTNKPWRWLETFPTQAAVLAEWKRCCLNEFERAETFLIPTSDQSPTFPCINRNPCDCEHRVVVHSPTHIVACCQCEAGDCPTIRLQPSDLIVYKLDAKKLGEAVRSAFKFELVEPRLFYSAPRMLEIGAFGPINSSVFFHIPFDEGSLLRELEGLFISKMDPFLLVMPTRCHLSAEIESCLKARRCAFIPMSMTLSLGDKGRLSQTNSIAEILKEFKEGLVRGYGLVKTVEKFGRDLNIVAQANYELRAAKQRLEQMHGEGLFGFAGKIDREARDIFFMILAKGDVAKACREMEMKDSTLRSKIAGWKQRGKPYVALAEFIRWRKSITGEAGINFAKRLASGGEKNVDHAGLVRDVLEELLDLDPQNCEERCERLIPLLRASLS